MKILICTSLVLLLLWFEFCKEIICFFELSPYFDLVVPFPLFFESIVKDFVSCF